MSNFKSIKEYFSVDKTFVVPYYQRGYKWSLQKNIKRGDLHLSLLLSDLKNEFQLAYRDGDISPHYEYYLQGITVKERNEGIELVDGQQRTTSLFILLCCLKHKGIAIDIDLNGKLLYKVRRASNDLLQGFLKGYCEGDESIQDIAALKKAWHLIDKALDSINNLELFTRFLLENIKIIYIKLDENQDETKVFSMMNKDKAEMSETDLVKSNILREASRQMFGHLEGMANDGLEWQINQLRGKLANEWDNWRKWWENKQHLEFVRMLSLPSFSKKKAGDEPEMGTLLNLYKRIYDSTDLKNSTGDKKGLYEYFKDVSLDRSNNKIEAIENFDNVRLIQHVLQEWYNDVEIYNYLGILFKGSGLKKKEEKVGELIKAYLKNKNNFHLHLKDEYIKQILDGEKNEDFINSIINDTDAYHNQYTTVARQLLRMNVQMSTKQKQKFDFSLYEELNYKNNEDIDNASRRSLEHIKPQTYRNKNLSVKELESLKNLTNSIGNLVLVPKGLNSKLSNKFPEEKKKILFDEMLKAEGRNFGLWLHTLSVFGSNAEWLSKDINANEKLFQQEFYSFFKESGK